MKIDDYCLRTTKRKGNLIRIEVVADSMRVGKTTAVAVIAGGLRKQKLGVFESYEDWQHNPYLKKSYEDPEKNFLESQKWFIKRKYQQIVDGVGTPLRSTSFGGARQIFIQDVSPECDYNYCVTNLRLGRMSQAHFDEYEKYYHSLDWGLTLLPDLLVYLTIGDDELIKRANASRREFESVDSDYFLTMKKVNREWLKRITNLKFSNSQMKILKINTDKLDFANDAEAMKELVERVIKKLTLFE